MDGLSLRPLVRDWNDFNINNRRNVNANNRQDNAFGMIFGLHSRDLVKTMKTFVDLYDRLCSYENLELAFMKARKRKTLKPYVIEFESNLDNNLKQLKQELETFTYSPAPLNTFIIRDPKTRKISASHFKDRVVHHALCNIIEPILSKSFIHDSFANQKGKGTHKAIERFEEFMKKVKLCGARPHGGGQRKIFDFEKSDGCVLKADIRHYFDTIDHKILLQIVEHRIKDQNVIWLLNIILQNHKTQIKGKGMPIGNLTSQFLANVYLNELDYFIKQKLQAKYYIRYVDDFVILHEDRDKLQEWMVAIDGFLKNRLEIELHPEKTKILLLNKGITFLGFRVFPKYRLLKKSNTRRIWKRIDIFKQKYTQKEISLSEINLSLYGWLAYAKFADTYKLRNRIIDRCNSLFDTEFTEG